MSEGKSVEEGKDNDMSHLEEEDEEDEDEDGDDEEDEDHDEDIDHGDHKDDGVTPEEAKLLATEEGQRSLLMRRESDDLTLDDDKKKGKCKKGFFRVLGSCIRCKGEVRRRRHMYTCTDCKAGETPRYKRDKCKRCKGGEVRNKKCYPCGKGYWSADGIKCGKCESGKERRRRGAKKC